MNGNVPNPEQQRIAYFTMEIGISTHIPTYSGGLGILAGDTVKTFADMKLPAVTISMLNEKGYFEQEIDEDGNQVAKEVEWNPTDNLVRMPHEVTVTIEGRQVKIRAWKHVITGIQGNTVPVYYLDTNVEGNTDYDRTLTSYLYGGDREYRLCQEIILGIGGIKMLTSLGYHNIKKYHMNEGHAALLTIELLKNTAAYHHKGGYDEEDVKQKCVFTTHTPVAAGHDRFDLTLFKRLLGDYVPQEVLDKAIDDGKVNMTLIGINLSDHVNGVAKRHGEVTKSMFPTHQIDYITNGIHPPTWASQEMTALFDQHVPGWKTDPHTLRNALSIPSDELWQAHQGAKKRLIQEVNDRTDVGFDHRRFTIGFARRFTAYKRPDLILHDLDRLKRIAKEKGDIQVVFAGKAHKSDTEGQRLIRKAIKTCEQVNEEGGRLKMVFLKGYDIHLARLLVGGCDVWLNNPQRPYEASGTSGMKAALNGVPQVSTLDGWWIEGHVEGVTGWRIGPNPKEEGFDNDYGPEDEAADLYHALEDKIMPLHYGKRHEWVRLMKHSIAINASFFNTYRMVQQYLACSYRE